MQSPDSGPHAPSSISTGQQIPYPLEDLRPVPATLKTKEMLDKYVPNVCLEGSCPCSYDGKVFNLILAYQ